MCTVRFAAIVALMIVAGGETQAQEQTFVLEAILPCCAAGEHRFGWLDASNAGVDPADAPEPPLPLGPHLAAAFRMPGVVNPDRWRRDYRATTDFGSDGRETWELLLSTNTAPATCTLTITAAVGDPSDLLLIFTGAFQGTLAIPATINFPLASEAQLFIEVVPAALPNETVTWGAVKSKYD